MATSPGRRQNTRRRHVTMVVQVVAILLGCAGLSLWSFAGQLSVIADDVAVQFQPAEYNGQDQDHKRTWRQIRSASVDSVAAATAADEEGEHDLAASIRLTFALLGGKLSYRLNNEHACKGGGQSPTVDIIMCVHSHPANVHFRQAIRRTWAHPRYWSREHYVIKTLFFTGVPVVESAADITVSSSSSSSASSREDTTVQEALEMESNMFGDIVQSDFEDTYRNLTFKVLSVLRWVATYCSHATYFVKVDDDVVVNVFTLQDVLRNNTMQRDGRRIACYTFINATVSRAGKWAASKRDVSEDVYPPFCAGIGYVTQVQTAISLLAAAHHVPFFWIDDIYVTGYVARYANVTFHRIDATWTQEKTVRLLTSYRWRPFVFGHTRQARAIDIVWGKMQRLWMKEQNITITNSNSSDTSLHVS